MLCPATASREDRVAPINSRVKQAEAVGCSEIRGAEVVEEHFGDEFVGLAEPGGSRGQISSTSTLGGPQLCTRQGCRSTQTPPPDHGSGAVSLRVAFPSPSETCPCTPALSTHPSLVPCTTIPSQSGAIGEKSPDLGLCARGRTSWSPPSPHFAGQYSHGGGVRRLPLWKRFPA